MKRVLFILIVLLSFVILYSEEESGSKVSMGGSVGTVLIGDETYMRLRLNPELKIGKLGIGLDVDLLVTEDGDIREEDWDDWQDYINKLYYVRWSERGDTFFAKVGGFSSYTLGMGLVMSDYTNSLNYPQERQIGLMAGGKLPIMDMEVEGFTSNVTNPTILAGRVSVAPLNRSNLPLLDRLRLGMTIGYDIDQYEGITEDEEELIMNTVDTDKDGVPDVDDYDPDGDHKFTEETLAELGFSEAQISEFEEKNWIDHNELLDNPLENLPEEELLVWGLDYKVPLVESDKFKLDHYSELSHIDGHGYGFIFPGFYSQFWILHMNLEFRQYEEDYLAGYFDHFYDQDRAYLQYDAEVGSSGEYVIKVKEEMLATTVAQQGWFGKIRADLFDIVYLEVGYTDMYAKDSHDGLKSLIGTLGLNTKVVPKLKNMEIKYYQMDVPEIEKLIAPRVVIKGTLRYELSAGTNLLWEYQERYQEINGIDGIQRDEEAIRNVSMGVEFQF